jgi:DNA repair protein RadD
MGKAIRPRDYQQDAIDSALQWFRDGKDKPLIVLPTGTGKSIVIAEICRRIVQNHPSTRIVMGVHVKELVQQNFDKLMALWPSAPAGIYSAGLGLKQHRSQILFGNIQSMYRNAAKIGHVDLFIPDEGHLIPRKGEGMWRTFENDLRSVNPNMRKLGMTATPYRLDSGLILGGEDPQFNGVCYEYSVADAIKDGWLSEIISAPVSTHLKTEGVKKRGSEFVAGDLERAVDLDHLTAACCDEIINIGEDRKSWLIFAAGNSHAKNIHEYLQSKGFAGYVVTQETGKEERSLAISQLTDGQCRYIVNNQILTTGFDCPRLDLIACLRPTQSAGLWVQMLGRGMRLFQGKQNCILLDFGRNLDRHGPIDKISGSAYVEKEGGGEAPIKNCDKCFAVVHAAVTVCPDCGYNFPARDVSLTKKASTEAVFSFQKSEPIEAEVLTMDVSRNRGRFGKPDTLRVSYSTLAGEVNEFICFDHPEGSFPYTKAMKWAMEDPEWRPGLISNIEDALSFIWTEPCNIVISKKDKYWNLIKREF